MQKLRTFFLAALVMLIVGWAAPASADTIIFDPDGGGALAPREIDSLDWTPGNAIGIGVRATDPAGTTFQLFYQANLGSALNSDGEIVYVNNTGAAGTEDSFTLVLGFQETISTTTFDPNTNTGNLTFAFDSGGANFFQIYANTVPGSNLSGACFVCGTLVMSGSIIPDGFVSNFSALATAPTTPLDQAGATNNYPTVTTIAGTGSVSLTGAVEFYNTSYFSGIGGSTIEFAFANANTNLPFLQADPSACFFATTSTGGISPTCTGTGGQTGVAPFVGVGSVDPVNGISGPNIMFQADGNASFDTNQQVPEPVTLLLLGIGLLGSAATHNRQKAKK